jgi:hypothetical protein
MKRAAAKGKQIKNAMIGKKNSPSESTAEYHKSLKKSFYQCLLYFTSQAEECQFKTGSAFAGGFQELLNFR